MFDLKSVDLSYDAPWLGIFRKDEILMNQYDQYKYLSEIKGEFRMNKLRFVFQLYFSIFI
jgi:hypothetical protein